jgi:hypothetical protein
MTTRSPIPSMGHIRFEAQPAGPSPSRLHIASISPAPRNHLLAPRGSRLRSLASGPPSRLPCVRARCKADDFELVDGVIGSEIHWSHTLILKSYEDSKRSWVPFPF